MLLYKTKKWISASDSSIYYYILLHSQLHQLLGKHLHRLVDEYTISKHIRSTPEIVFHRNTSLRDKLTQSHYTPTSGKSTPSGGLFRCGSCDMCPWVEAGTLFSFPNGEVFRARFHANCNTRELCTWCSVIADRSMSVRRSDNLDSASTIIFIIPPIEKWSLWLVVI